MGREDIGGKQKTSEGEVRGGLRICVNGLGRDWTARKVIKTVGPK